MKAIQANPCSIRQLFQSTYLIPEYQRPYTWEEDKCSQLWDDLETFFTQFTGDENYFLGSIVIHEEQPIEKKEQAGGKKWVVIDGQQRLMTLSLLLHAFLKIVVKHDVLNRCLYIFDAVDGNAIEGKTRVTSKVAEQDNTALHNILLGNNEDADPSSRFAKNYAHLNALIADWCKPTSQNPEKLMDLIACILDKVTILPIECGNEEDALTLFQVINDRGTPLGDVDIFKAKIYKALKSGQEKGDFIEQWNNLKHHEWLFRVNMHIQRAKDKDKGNERQLRAYYNQSKDKFFQNAETATILVNDLKLLHGVDNWETVTPLISNWWFVLERFPNHYWNFPLYAYLHKYGRNNDEEGFTLADEEVESFEKLMHEVARYCYVKQLRYNQVNRLKQTIYEAYIAIAKGEDYLGTLAKGCEQDIDAVVSMIEKDGVPYGRTLYPVVYLLALLNPKQRNSEASFYYMGKHNVEHILPKQWFDTYGGWTEEQVGACLNTVGNLVLIDKKTNIRANNEFFQKKQTKYRKHKVVEDVKALSNAAQYPKWHHEDWKKREKAMRKRLIDFLSTPTKP